MLTVAVNLTDTVTVTDLGPFPGRDELEVADAAGAPSVASDPGLLGEGSLVMRAMGAFRELAGWPDRRVKVSVIKRIPYCAGLGGVSSDAAAVLRVMALLAPGALSRESLEGLAFSLGADLPFFLGDGLPKIVRGAGEDISPYPAAEDLPRWVTLASPGSPLATRDVFREYELTKSRPGNSLKGSGAPGGPPDGFPPPVLPRFGENDLLPAVLRLEPVAARLLEDLSRMASGRPFGLSGSGPCFWALSDDALEASRLEGRLSKRGWWCHTCAVLRG
jgi:4-diphosphocytidyl-2-C-methyl-D-erythritol kinase